MVPGELINPMPCLIANPLRGLKRDTYEGGHRVPYIVKWPGKVKAGETCSELVSQVDIMATLASVVGYELPEDQAEDSHDLLPLITGKTNKGPRTAHVHNTFSGSYAIRQGDWLLVNAPTGYAGQKRHFEKVMQWHKKHGYTILRDKKGLLFNLKDDIGQKHNVIESNPEKAKQLRALLNKIRKQGHSAPRLEK